MNIGLVEASLTSTRSSSLSSSRRRRAQPTNQPDRLKRRDVEFMHQTVSVVKKIGEFNASYLYSATDDDSKKRRTSKNLWIKATAAGTTEEARRAESEVRLLRRLSTAPGIPKMIDCGFSTIEERVYNYERTDENQLDIRRLYCILFEACPDYFVADFIKKRRRKYDKRRTRGLFVRKKREDEMWEGYLSIDVILDIFGQMAKAVSALHAYQDDPDPKTAQTSSSTKNREGIVHLDIQPARFLIRKAKEKGDAGEKYQVSLCGFGCSVRGSVPLTTESDRIRAGKCIEASTTAIYRSPEMINMHMSDELNGSADIWGLGCSLYALLFLTDCFKGHSKLDLLRGVFLLPAKHPYQSEVIDLLARMLTVNQDQRASIEDVLRCIDCLKAGKPLPPRKRSHHDAGKEVDQGIGDFGFSVDKVVEAGQAQTPTAVHSDSPAVHTDGPTTEGDTTDSREHQSMNDPWDFAPGEISSDGTEISQWLEFQPDNSDGSNLQQRTEPVSPPKATQRRSIRRRRRRNDPLSLGSAQGEDGKKLFRDWTLGLINQLSSRSLVPIDADASVETEMVSRDGAITPLREPSFRRITPFTQASRKLSSGPSSSSSRSPYGSGYNLTSAPSLRVTDLISDSAPRGIATSSSEMLSTNASSGNNNSSDFLSSTEMQSSSEIGSMDFTASDLSSSVTRTPLNDKSLRALETPQSAPPNMSRMPGMLGRGVSPNMPPTLPYRWQTEMLSPRVTGVAPDALDDLPRKPSMAGRQMSDSELVKMKKSKSKKSRKKKDESSKKKRKKRKSRSRSRTEQKAGKEEPPNVSQIQERDQTKAREPSLRESGNTANFSIPEFDHDAGTGTGTGTEDDDTKEPSLHRRATWGDIASPGDWAKSQVHEMRKKRKKPKSMKKIKSEPSRSLKPAEIDAEVLESFAASASTSSTLGAWDLKAAEQWVNTKSQEASQKGSYKPTDTTREVKDPYYMKRSEHPQSPQTTAVPKDWMKDARQWVSNKSPTKVTQVSQLRDEMKRELSNRSKPASEGDSVSNRSQSNRSHSNRSRARLEAESVNSRPKTPVEASSFHSRSKPDEADSTWFASPVAKGKTSLVSPSLTDNAGFPLPENSFARVKSETKVTSGHHDRDQKQLNNHFLTPQYKRSTFRVPRSATSAGETSGERRGLLHQHTTSRRESRKDSFKREQQVSLKSGPSLQTPPVLEKPRSVDSNVPPGDEVVTAEVSIPPADAEERERNNLSVKEEVHMALTAEGRQMRRSIKKMEQESPHDLLSRLLSQEKEPEKPSIPKVRSRPPTPEREREEKMNKSTGTMNVPTMIELFAVDNEDLEVAAAASPEIGRHLLYEQTPQSETHRLAESMLPSAPQLSPRTPSRKAKKKKKSKSKSKERERVKKARSERVTRSMTQDTTPASMSRSMPVMENLEGSFTIDDLIEAERAATILGTEVSSAS